ncbi:hypothetical protein N752_02115 [Desulforamulus aquiferis]|nr:hypothetical protein N752_02115 [Desulforamulus aquiferis]
MYGKTMSIPDELMIRYFELVTPVPMEEIKSIEKGLTEGTLHPRDVKMRLGREIVAFYHGAEAAIQSEEHFKKVFQKRELPDEIDQFIVTSDLYEEGLVAIPRLLTQPVWLPVPVRPEGWLRKEQLRLTEKRSLIQI